jgi:toxin secretion/phage lysis holin
VAGFFCTYSHALGGGEVLYPVFALVFIDAFVGVMKAVKLKTFKWSQGFKRSIQKTGVYVAMILLAGILDLEFPGHYASTTMKTFLMVTEAISILENINSLGWPVPLKLLEYLKTHRKNSSEKKKN